MTAGPDAYELIIHFEQLHDADLTKIGLQPKQCPAGIFTGGYGHAFFYNGVPVKDMGTLEKYFPMYLTMTVEQAENLLQQDVSKVERKINSQIARVNQNQFDALVSYFFNIGTSNTMIELVNHGAGDKEINEWFVNHYTTANGVFLPGLKFRRMSESLLYRTGELKFFN